MSSSIKSRAQLDDTVPVKCVIESSYSVKDHTEYSIGIQFGPLPATSWKITKRYSDFAALDAILRSYGHDLPLPPKKVFGNMDSDFISCRQQGLQNYLDAILTCQWVSVCLDVKLFLCPPNFLSISYQDTALQNICMFLRSENNWELVEPLPSIGWRLRKCYFLVRNKTQPKQKYILTWCCLRPSHSIDNKDLEQVMKFFSSFQHPGIEPAIFSACNNTCSVTVRKFHEKGSLRDYICNANPTVHFQKKYANPKSSRCIQVSDIKLFGRNILETLKFLHERGYPFVHLHSGNVVISNGLPLLLDLENWAIGVPHLHHPLFSQLHKIQSLEAMEVYSFGHLIYEMLIGHPLPTSNCDNFTQDHCSPELKSMLSSILGTTASKSGLPNISDLISHPFFKDVPVEPNECTNLKVSSKLREIFHTGQNICEQKMREEQNLLHQHRRMAKAEAFHMSAEEKKKRRLQSMKSLNEMTIQDDQEQSPEIQKPSSTALSSNGASAERTVPTSPRSIDDDATKMKLKAVDEAETDVVGREGLLTSIVGFNKSNMKKAETIDKSQPLI